MKIRLRLILAFFLLAVVPLTGLVLYSYYASLEAVRQSTEEEAIATVGELERRMTEVRSDLTASFERAATMPGAPMPETTLDGEGGVDVVLDRILSTLGEDAGLFEAIEVIPFGPPPEPDPPGDQPLPVSTAEAPAPPAPELPPLVISSLPTDGEGNSPMSLEGNVTFDLEALKDHAELGQLVRTLTSGADLLQALGALDEGAEGQGELWGNAVRYRLEQQEVSDEERRWRAFMTTETGSEEGEGTDGETPPGNGKTPSALAATRQFLRESRKLAQQEQRRQAREAARQGAAEAERTQRDTETLLGRPVAVPVRAGDRLMAKVRPEIRADALLRRVLDFSDRSQGEVPFALDAEGHLFVSDEADREVLETLDLVTTQSPNVQRIDDQPWVVAALGASDGNFTFGIARPLGGPFAEIRRTASRNFAYGLGLVGLALFGIAPLSRRITGDLQTVTQGAERIAKGDLDTRVEVRSTDEIGQLAETFNSMARQLADHEQQREEEARQRRDAALSRQQLQADVDRKTRELEEAREFQLSLLPKALPEHPAFAMAVEIRTATEVGGDYYDFLHTADALTVTIGDATGHGARAGTMVTVTKSLFSAYPEDGGPGAFLQQATQTIRRMDLGRMNMALSVGELRSDRLRLATAGMPPVLLYRAATGEVEELSQPGLPLGSRLPCTYREIDLRLFSGDTLLWTTDGVPELIAEGPCSPTGEVFGYERLHDVFTDVAQQAPATILEAINQAIDTWCCNERPNDDITLLVIKKR